MRIDNPSTVFEHWAHRYTEHMKALGRSFYHDTWTIKRLCRFLAERGTIDLDQVLFEQWCATHRGLCANVRRTYQRVVRKLCLYRQRIEPDCFVPDASRFPQRQPHRAPVIVSPSQIAGLLRATEALRCHGAVPLRSAMMRLAVVLLYTAGLRRGELVRLRLGDIDLKNGTAKIRDTKFYKSRFVPLSIDAQRELRAYLKQRLASPWNVFADAPLIGGHQHTTVIHDYCGRAINAGIRQLCIAANVRDADGRLPRVHDFRHSFAVQALLRWYRDGADVQSCLPKLAMYMGHQSIASTAYYLHWIPEIARTASSQFERRFGHLIEGEPA
ncbi:MAG: tyrosine-type recombinase/integrase [Gammaproteobacteria bacterium]|nr:tyrosine-type recombinase/integrase [Gammaproteobacteria bacterium]MYF58643.1 tyrosine-type recombinase/integrase [Gammaproteobacteria bacterium]